MPNSLTLEAKFSLFPASADDARAAAHSAQSGGGVQAQLPTMLDEQIGDLVFLEVSPEIFDRIELGSIGWQPLQPEAPVAAGEGLLDRFAAVDRGAIPDDKQFAWDMAQQRLEELGGLGTADAAFINPEVEPIQRQPGDDRQLVPAERLVQQRGLPTRRPGANPMRSGAQPAFVDEDDGAAFPPGFFLRRGHSTRFQWAICSSLRSIARRLGRWQLKPSVRNTFETWAGW